MRKVQFVQLLLTCETRQEAEAIAHALLEQKLIACAKYIPVDCSYWWQGKITEGQEILLLMESREDYFAEVEKVVAKLHSYDTFVLQAVPLQKVSNAATKWLTATLEK